MEPRRWHRAYDPQVAPDVDFEDLTLSQYPARSARDFPTRPVLVFGNGRLTYAELAEQVGRAAPIGGRSDGALPRKPGADKVPRAGELRAEPPRISVSKILRRELRAQELAKGGTSTGA